MVWIERVESREELRGIRTEDHLAPQHISIQSDDVNIWRKGVCVSWDLIVSQGEELCGPRQQLCLPG